MYARSILVTALYFICMPAYTQKTTPKKLLFEAITINDGLSQGMVTWITQDHHGFLWFATKDGLNRYDGYHFTVYRHDPSNSNSIADNYTETIFEDSKGRLWIGTRSKGLELFNRETETFQHFKKGLENDSDLEHVSSITEDKQGQIWITTENGIVVLTEHADKKSGTPVFSFRKVNHKLSHVFVAQNGTVWISEIDGSLFAVNRNRNGKETISPIPLYTLCPDKSKSAGDKNPWVFAEDTASRRLYVFMKYCILEFDEKQNVFNLVHHTEKENVFNFFACVNKKTIWLINNFRLQQFDINTSQLTFVEGATSETQKLTSDVRFVYTDRSGIIWVGTAGFGILKYNPRIEKFHHTDDESIHWMTETNDGKILVLKNGAYLNLFDKTNGSYSAVIPDSITRNSRAYNYGVVEAAMQDDDGAYWICKESLLNYDATTKNIPVI
jgi:ligand-binding sensor domain-containing protein